MAVKSILEIDVDDAAFQRYAAAFAKYQDQLKDMPGLWARVGQGSAEASEAAHEMGTAVGAAFFALHRAAGESKSLSVETARQASAWTTMATDAGKFANRIVEATRSLLRWGELTGLISGIVGAGGLFGIDRLATNAGNTRRASLGLGTTSGELRAFDTNFERVVDTHQMLGGVNEALHDVTKRASLYGAGFTEDELRGKDTAQVSSEMLMHLKKIADQTPDAMLGNVLQARHLDQFIDLQGLERLKRTPVSELQEYQRNYARDQQTFRVPDSVNKAWQDLQTMFTRAGQTLETTLIRGLVALAPQIEHLSQAFVTLVEKVVSSDTIKQWIDQLASGIKWLADTIDTPAFHEGVMQFIAAVGRIAAKAEEVVAASAGIISGMESVKGFGDKLVAMIPDETQFEAALDNVRKAADALATSIDLTVKGIHAIVDPWINGRALTQPEAEQWNKDHPDRAIPQDQMNKLDPGPGSATGWDRLKNWWNGGSFGGHLDHPASYEPGDPSLPRGVRNNNPLNLAYLPGQGASGSDGRFGVYDTPEQGIAASERQLLLYQDRDHLNTISQIVSKWAPSNENDTASYIAQVSKDTGINPNAQIDLHDSATSKALVEAMIRRETGRRANDDVVQRGVDMGLGGARPMQAKNGNTTVAIRIDNQTGGNAAVSASQLVA